MDGDFYRVEECQILIGLRSEIIRVHIIETNNFASEVKVVLVQKSAGPSCLGDKIGLNGPYD